MRITGPGRLGIASLLTGLAAGAALLGAAPAASAEPPAESQAEARIKCVEQDPYFFHGESGQPGGFSTEAPTSPAPAAQVRPYGAGASWADSFHGDLCGQVTITVYPASTSSANSRSPFWMIMVIADGDDTIVSRRHRDAVGFTPQEVTVTHRLRVEVAVTAKLEFRAYDVSGVYGVGAVLYDSPDYAAGFTISTLQPCEVDDAHPDCRFGQLSDQVTGFATTGEVTADGETQLLATLGRAETAYAYGGGDTARAVALLEDFQQLAADPALVPSDPAGAELQVAASDLIAALRASGPA